MTDGTNGPVRLPPFCTSFWDHGTLFPFDPTLQLFHHFSHTNLSKVYQRVGDATVECKRPSLISSNSVNPMDTAIDSNRLLQH